MRGEGRSGALGGEFDWGCGGGGGLDDGGGSIGGCEGVRVRMCGKGV